MANFYVGYGHKSIGDCGTITLFIEGISMLAAKAIQDWPLYSGQEASTRYVDFSTQAFIDPVATKDSQEILEAWRSFYSFENMKVILSSADPENYWDIFRNFYWYKNSALNEGAHPMITGFFPLKDRRTRRPGFEREGRLAHAWRRIPEIYKYCRGAFRLTLEMEELWLQTRRRSETEKRVVEELARMLGAKQAGDAAYQHARELAERYAK